MGSPWKMPTKTQGEELINCTNHIYTTINGVNGMKFTSNTDTSKYIFLTAAGKWGWDTHSVPGTWGFYYFASLQIASDGTYAYQIYFTPSTFSFDAGNMYFQGYSVRAIQTALLISQEMCNIIKCWPPKSILT